MNSPNTMSVIELITAATRHLEEKGFENARLEVELLLGCVLEKSRIQLYMEFDRLLTEEETESFRSVYRRRLAREPLQYITGETGFRELDVATNPKVFIPRPETEILVQHAVEFLALRPNPLVVDLGAGSGIIAVSVAYEVPGSRVVAVDINEEALFLTECNARKAGVLESLAFVHGDMIASLEGRGPFDAILSNPPYVKTADIEGLDAEVREYEPAAALDGGAEGLDFLIAIAGCAHRHLKSGGLVLLECEGDQADAVSEILINLNRYSSVETIIDLAGKKRIVKALLAG